MKKITLILILSFVFCIKVYAEERYNFTTETKIYINGEQAEKLNDNNYFTYEKVKANNTIEIYSPKDIVGVYIIYYLNAQIGELSYNGHWQRIGNNGFLHEYIELDGQSNLIDLTYKNDVTIKEIFLFDKVSPDWVEKWENPHDDADILLFPAHGDDEHIFFAGLIPKMIDDGKKIQVAYFVDHSNWPIRYDEQLRGLWEAGLRNYPLFGIIPDAYSTSLDGALKNLKKSNVTIDDATKYMVDTIRKFKPEVVVAHDENGEYGHGQHRLSTYVLENAINYLNDENYESDYEPFMPYKIYIHLYEKNQIIMDYDIPLATFGGKTAFRVSMDALKKHESQKRTRWNEWQKLNNAKEIEKYSPMYFGLYYSSVGYVNEDNNLFYNIPEKKTITNIIENTNDKPNSEQVILNEQKKEKKDLQYSIKIILMIIVVVLLISTILLIIFKLKKKKS